MMAYLYQNVFITEGVLPATEIASQVDGVSFAYPTIVTGSFLISYSPGEEIGCRVEEGKPHFEDFFRTLDECHDIFLTEAPNYQRLFGGKMNDIYGNYVPLLYIDGYIDINGKTSAQEAIDFVLADQFDEDLCNRLSWLTALCRNRPAYNFDDNKCYYDFEGSYVQNNTARYGQQPYHVLLRIS